MSGALTAFCQDLGSRVSVAHLRHAQSGRLTPGRTRIRIFKYRAKRSSSFNQCLSAQESRTSHAALRSRCHHEQWPPRLLRLGTLSHAHTRHVLSSPATGPRWPQTTSFLQRRFLEWRPQASPSTLSSKAVSRGCWAAPVTPKPVARLVVRWPGDLRTPSSAVESKAPGESRPRHFPQRLPLMGGGVKMPSRPLHCREVAQRPSSGPRGQCQVCSKSHNMKGHTALICTGCHLPALGFVFSIAGFVT